MRRAFWFVPAACLLLGCAEERASVTRSDAIALGFETIACAGVLQGPILAKPAGPSSLRLQCLAVEAALGALTDPQSGLLDTSGLLPDSVTVIVVELRASEPPHASPDYLMVTLELPGHANNAYVEVTTDGDPIELGWAPLGLRY